MVALSIVIPSFNQASFLDAAIVSVLAQKTDAVELLVIDGGSDDGSVEIIRRHSSSLAYWESRKDRGQSHAINKGWTKAGGKYLTWLNSDDLLLPGAIAAFLQCAESPREPVWIAGNSVWMSATGMVRRCSRGGRCDRRHLLEGRIHVGGPTCFLSRDLIQRVGMLREDFHYMMDTEMWCRLVTARVPLTRIAKYMWALRLHPQAKTSGHLFADSAFADRSHTSWRAKENERARLRTTYHYGARDSLLRRIMFRWGRVWRFETPRALLDTIRFRGRAIHAVQPGSLGRQ